MKIPGVSVWKASNGIFIEYFWQYFWEPLVLTRVFVLLRQNFRFPKLRLSFCLFVCVLLSLLFSLSLFLSCLMVHTGSRSVPWYLFSLSAFSNHLQISAHLNLIPNALQKWPSYNSNCTELFYPVHCSSMEVRMHAVTLKPSLITVPLIILCAVLWAGSSWKPPNNCPWEQNLIQFVLACCACGAVLLARAANQFLSVKLEKYIFNHYCKIACSFSNALQADPTQFMLSFSHEL